MQLPKPVIDGVQAELADLRIAAKDIGRRITQYEADGRERPELRELFRAPENRFPRGPLVRAGRAL
ncbi:MAG: hypothetical protein IPK34_13185 [Ramlibacter sp.]|nr:hypothetical protein [Ramlibacter sp.]